ncbi:MAG TPA: adenylyl-sulfate kinase [Candidatus Thermoplasmatota archaeon]|nr:adenylyl-sulfate kinase [Candidatus Thermoplasmatota archaeon]
MTERQGFTVWFTGLPCCGKSTVADRVAVILRKNGYRVERLDGDVVREGLTNDLGFSREDRDENIRRIAFVANMLSRNGVVVLATFVSPYRQARRDARRVIGRFIEVYVRCPVEVCMKRDVKGMYKKALEGKIKHFTGVDDPYEEPEHPELIVDTDKESVEESVSKVLATLTALHYLS